MSEERIQKLMDEIRKKFPHEILNVVDCDYSDEIDLKSKLKLLFNLPSRNFLIKLGGTEILEKYNCQNVEMLSDISIDVHYELGFKTKVFDMYLAELIALKYGFSLNPLPRECYSGVVYKLKGNIYTDGYGGSIVDNKVVDWLDMDDELIEYCSCSTKLENLEGFYINVFGTFPTSPEQFIEFPPLTAKILYELYAPELL
jgi:hypothetical protein